MSTSIDQQHAHAQAPISARQPAGVRALLDAHARCRGLGPAIYYDRALRRVALGVCGTCPLANWCLYEALATEEACGAAPDSARYRYGIWGGTTPAWRGACAAYLAAQGLSARALASLEQEYLCRTLEAPPRTARKAAVA